MTNLNLLGSYIWKRIQKENPMRSRTHPREYLTGLFINAKDIQRYIYDYVNYGIDYTGDDNISSEDTFDEIERYWDLPDGKEE
jgi:hypothetical protein|tara:strand:+ start:826 stop:1074 length:249 start_codon:yes stop_codon:yes gene_type:complete